MLFHFMLFGLDIFQLLLKSSLFSLLMLLKCFQFLLTHIPQLCAFLLKLSNMSIGFVQLLLQNSTVCSELLCLFLLCKPQE